MQDRILGITVALTGAYAVYHGMGFSAEKGVLASAGALPVLVGLLLLGLGVSVAIKTRGKSSGFEGHWQRLLYFGLLTAAYILGLSHLGFIMATPPYLLVLLALTGDRPKKARIYAGLALAVIMTAGTYALFDKVFRLLLP
ncbi:MAG: hypothetical protein HPY55_03585 [Firmicutes bacterium]|nr:hypothetical protein [Bacillota bacterium]